MQKSLTAAKSSIFIEVLDTLVSSAVPALPGQTKTSDTDESCAHFHARACSLPPDPIIKMYIF